jgi:hypothetical protein
MMIAVALTYDSGNPALDRKMPGLYGRAIIANPYVMREMPRLLRQIDVDITHAIGEVIVETVAGEYFSSLAENYGPIAVGAGVVDEAEVTAWTQGIAQAQAEGVFFASCNFMTYCAVKAG